WRNSGNCWRSRWCGGTVGRPRENEVRNVYRAKSGRLVIPRTGCVTHAAGRTVSGSNLTRYLVASGSYVVKGGRRGTGKLIQNWIDVALRGTCPLINDRHDSCKHWRTDRSPSNDDECSVACAKTIDAVSESTQEVAIVIDRCG